MCRLCVILSGTNYAGVLVVLLIKAGSCDVTSAVTEVDCIWNVMAHAQKPDFIFRRKGRVHLNRQGRQFSRLLAAEVCAWAVVMLDTSCSEVVWRVLATHSIRQFFLHFPTRASPCTVTWTLLIPTIGTRWVSVVKFTLRGKYPSIPNEQDWWPVQPRTIPSIYREPSHHSSDVQPVRQSSHFIDSDYASPATVHFYPYCMDAKSGFSRYGT